MAGSIQFSVVFKEYASAAMEKVKGMLAGLKTQANSVGRDVSSRFGQMFTVGALLAFGRSVVNYMGQIKDASEATGLAADNFQALSMVAKENGIDTGKLTSMLMRFRDVQSNIGQDERMQKVFAKLGLSVAEVQNSTPDELLKRIADGIKSTGNASVAFDLFGRGGARMLSTLNDLTVGWDKLKERTKGGIISNADLAAIDEFGDRADTMFTKLKAASAKTVLALAKGWGSFWAAMGAMSGGSTWSEAWDIAANQELPNRSPAPAVKETPGPDLVAQKRDDAIAKTNAQRQQIERAGKFELADAQTRLDMLSNEEAALSQIAKHHQDAVKRAQAELDLAKVRAAILKQQFDMRAKVTEAEDAARQSAAEYNASKLAKTDQLARAREDLNSLQGMLDDLDTTANSRQLSDAERLDRAEIQNAMLRRNKQIDDLKSSTKSPNAQLSVQSDRMARIGLFIGGAGSSGMMDYARRTAEATTKSVGLLERIANKSGTSGQATWGK